MIGNNTEKEYRDSQKDFGHASKPQDLPTWLRSTYTNENVKYYRYKNIATSFLSESRQPKVMNVLEIGAGVGDFIVFCSSLFPIHNYFANDLSQKQLVGNIAEVINYFKVKKSPALNFSPVEKLDYSDEQFDIIFVKAAVHHFENPELGLLEIYRVLKSGGRLVFFEDPVCLDIPIYTKRVKSNFCLNERRLGINEHIYTISDYLGFGGKFSKRFYYLDDELVKEFDKQQINRSGIKMVLLWIIRHNSRLFRWYMIHRFGSPIIFEYFK